MGRKMYYEMGADKFSVSTEVQRVIPGDRPQVCIDTASGETCETYDDVILASPADRIRKMLARDDTNFWRGLLLSQIRYESTHVAVHRDRNVVARVTNNSDLWKAFVYDPDGGEQGRFLLTGVMRRFPQPAAPYEPNDLFLSLNAGANVVAVAEETATWDHQTQDTWHVFWTRGVVPRVQGQDGIYLAGDWTFLIGHADALISGAKAGCNVGARRNGWPTSEGGTWRDVSYTAPNVTGSPCVS